MDLNYSPEDRAFRDKTRRWLEANVPSDDLKTLAERKAWHRKLYEAGYVGMLWPKEYGGWGATAMQQAIVQDEMARIQAPPAINGLGIGFIGPTIIV
ncbi:MAG TPA: acyl-CoA dehydrogenase family protein, partial [Methylomirabilota bacterium]|nr:acyl-CoA dehydrogenase family protein [Methylomirabilota bacterium]